MISLSKTLPVLFFAGVIALPVSLTAADIPRAKQTMAGLYLTATEAAEMLNDPEVLFIDIRSQAEVAFLGLPSRANVNIPFMMLPAGAAHDPEQGSYGLALNESFADDLLDYVSLNGYRADTPIVLICRSGSRSAKAANILTAMGFARVYSVIDGHEDDKAAEGPEKGHRVVNGWRNAGLDWSYRIAPEQVYPGDA